MQRMRHIAKNWIANVYGDNGKNMPVCLNEDDWE